MDKNSNELLEYIYNDALMGTKSMKTLLNTLNDKDNKIKDVVEDILKEYDSYLKECKKLLSKQKITPEKPSILAEIGSFMGIKMEMIKDNSDSRVADMIIKGLNMGVIDLGKKIEDFKDKADKSTLSLAKRMKEMQADEIEALKKFL